MKKLAIFIVLAFLLVLCVTPVYAQPKLPHAFYGSVTIDGAPASDGTEVSATVNIGDIVSTQNPVTTVGGSYGIGNPYLLVQGYGIPEGATITFYVDDVEAEGQTALFEAGGGPAKRDLSVTIPAPPVPPTRIGPPAIRAYVETTLFGVEGEFRISDEGEILETVEATSADGMLTITIPEGTIALDEDGEPLSSLTVDVDPSPPDPPEDANIIGLAYDFGPEGATFDPPITFTWSYDPDALPEDVAEEDLVIAYYDEDAGEWLELPCVVDTENNTVTASVSHFTTFAIITRVVPPPPAPAAFTVSALTIQPTEVQPEETVTITVSVANTGGTEGSYTVVLMVNGIKEAEKSVTVAAGASQLVSFAVAKEKAGSYSVVVDGLSGSFMVAAPPVPPPAPAPAPAPPPVKPPFNWPLIGGIIAAAIVVALLIYFLVVVRRRAY